MFLKHVVAGLALSGAALAMGCSCCGQPRSCGTGPAIVSSAPIAAPAPCCGGAAVPAPPVATGPTGPLYSSPVPLAPGH
jgi:hypothetical protein